MTYETNPYLHLGTLADRVKDALASQSSKKEFGDLWSGIGFVLCGRSMAASMGEVTEIITLPRCTFVPGSKDWSMGIANVRGTLLPLIDLENFFGSTLIGNRRKQRVLIVNFQGGPVGLVVSKVTGMLHISEESFEAAETSAGDVLGDFVDAVFQHAGQEWLRFSPEKLFASKDFCDAAQPMSSTVSSISDSAA